MVAKICSKFLDPSLKAALRFGFINGLLDPGFINRLPTAGWVELGEFDGNGVSTMINGNKRPIYSQIFPQVLLESVEISKCFLCSASQLFQIGEVQ